MPHPDPSEGLTPLRSQFADDPDMADLVGIFVTELPSRVEGVVTAYRSGDVESLRRIAHQLKGAAGGYGFPTVGDAAAKVEKALKTSTDPAGQLSQMTEDVRALVDLCWRASCSSSGSRVQRPTI